MSSEIAPLVPASSVERPLVQFVQDLLAVGADEWLKLEGNRVLVAFQSIQDDVTLDQLSTSFAENGYRFRDLLVELVAHESFAVVAIAPTGEDAR